MQDARKLITAGVVAYLLFLAVTFPFDRFIDLVEQRVPGLSLQDVDGSLWSGHAGQVRFQGQSLGAIDWRLQPLRLLTGRLQYQLGVQDPAASGSGDLGVRPGGAAYGRDVSLQLQPAELINHFSPVPVVTEGVLDLQLEQFELQGGFPRELQGELHWQGARLRSPVDLDLGDIAFSLESSDDELVATVTEGGSMNLSGDIRLSQGGTYAVNLLLRPGAQTGPDVQNMLATILQRGPGGSFRMAGSGKL